MTATAAVAPHLTQTEMKLYLPSLIVLLSCTRSLYGGHEYVCVCASDVVYGRRRQSSCFWRFSFFYFVICHCISFRVLFHLFLNALLSLLIAFSLTECAFDYRYHSNFCSLFSLSLSFFFWLDVAGAPVWIIINMAQHKCFNEYSNNKWIIAGRIVC